MGNTGIAGSCMLGNSCSLLTQSSHQLLHPTDASSLWGTRDPEHPHPVVPCTPNTPHLSSFPIQRTKAATGFGPIHSRCGSQLPTTQEASTRVRHENQTTKKFPYMWCHQSSNICSETRRDWEIFSWITLGILCFLLGIKKTKLPPRVKKKKMRVRKLIGKSVLQLYMCHRK